MALKPEAQYNSSYTRFMPIISVSYKILCFAWIIEIELTQGYVTHFLHFKG